MEGYGKQHFHYRGESALAFINDNQTTNYRWKETKLDEEKIVTNYLNEAERG